MEFDFDNMASSRTIELGALLRDYLLGLVMISGGGRSPESHPVQWVHVSDLEDPSPFLTPRTVLLTTGSQFETPLERTEADAYIQRLKQVGTTALGVGVGVQWDRIPPPLIEASEQAKLPLFRVPYDTPFIAVVRTAARLIEAQAHAEASWSREQFSSLSSLGRRRNLTEAEQAVRGVVLTLLLDDQRDLAERVAGTLLPRIPRGQISVICIPEPVEPPILRELTPLISEQAGVFSATEHRHSQETLIIAAEHGELAPLKRILAKHSLPCGISERGSASDISQLLEQAERASQLARHAPTPGPITYRPEMHAGVLQLLKQSPEATRRARGLLAPLQLHDERHRDDLQHSVTVWLTHHGQMSAAAADLGVHRHTLRTRVSTAASLLERDLDDPDVRAELWAALRIMRATTQAPGGSTP